MGRDDDDGPYSFNPFRSAWLASAVVVLGLVGTGLLAAYRWCLSATVRPTPPRATA